MTQTDRTPYIWTGLWVLLMAVSLLTRPILPVDETRYLAVAWEMWHSNNFLVPHLNGETYSHKPPLLFWAFHLGWTVFGINDWWPRLIAPFFGLGSLFLTAKLARQLWPQQEELSGHASMILLGCIFWTLFTTMTMFDMIVAFFSLLGLIGIVIAWRARGDGQSSQYGFFILAVAIGFGLLAKGPAILLHTLPVALSAPYWGHHLESYSKQKSSAGLFGWYAGIVIATLIGTAIVLAWALPAAYAGGEKYANAIFWGQSAGRMVDSFAHNRPIWWYAAVLPPLILPWIVWPQLWRAVKKVGRNCLNDGGIRLCLCWFLPAFIAFSLISGKQLHYLLPEFPALAMVGAFMLSHIKFDGRGSRKTLLVPVLLFATIGALIILAAPHLMPEKFTNRYPGLITEWAGLIVLAGMVHIWLKANTLRQSIIALTTLSIATSVSVHLMVSPLLSSNFDVKAVSEKLGEWERQGIPLAHMNKYHGQYNFYGRLKKPIAIVGNLDPDMEVWVHKFPNGKVISYSYRFKKASKKGRPIYTKPYKGKLITIWNAKTIQAHPNIARRN